MQLTKTLLSLDFNLKLELPDDRLCPPVGFRPSDTVSILADKVIGAKSTQLHFMAQGISGHLVVRATRPPSLRARHWNRRKLYLSLAGDGPAPIVAFCCNRYVLFMLVSMVTIAS